jgi:hypothetical protein
MQKRVLIWAIVHLIVAPLVIDEMRKRGKPDQEAKLAGHVAGAATGVFLASVL